jgi:hypothetical protein
LKLKENLKHIRFMFKKIKLGKTTISINKTDIKLMSTNRGLGRTPNIRIYYLKWSGSNTSR